MDSSFPAWAGISLRSPIPGDRFAPRDDGPVSDRIEAPIGGRGKGVDPLIPGKSVLERKLRLRQAPAIQDDSGGGWVLSNLPSPRCRGSGGLFLYANVGHDPRQSRALPCLLNGGLTPSPGELYVPGPQWLEPLLRKGYPQAEKAPPDPLADKPEDCFCPYCAGELPPDWAICLCPRCARRICDQGVYGTD